MSMEVWQIYASQPVITNARSFERQIRHLYKVGHQLKISIGDLRPIGVYLDNITLLGEHGCPQQAKLRDRIQGVFLLRGRNSRKRKTSNKKAI